MSVTSFVTCGRSCTINYRYCFRRNRVAALVMLGMLLSCLFAGVPAVAGVLNAPVIQVISASREVDGLTSWFPLPPPESGDGDNQDRIFTGTGLWVDSVNLNTGLASSFASQNSRIADFTITGEAKTRASLSDTGYAGDAGALSSISVGFTIPVDGAFVLTANFDFVGELTTGWSRGQVVMFGMNEQEVLIHNVDSEDSDTWSLLFNGTINAGTTASLTILVHSQRGKHPDIGDDEAGEARGSMKFSLDLGDRDGDGLLDTWEEEGQIDLGDGAIIDFSSIDPNLDVDPDRKDLFVEVDYLYDDPDVDLEMDIWPMIVESFANAPAEDVDNYDDSAGVNLHIFKDENLVGAPQAIMELGMEDQPQGSNLPNAYYVIKKANLGSIAIREHDLWDQGPLKEAWQMVFRYALWINRIQRPLDPEVCMGTTQRPRCSEGAYRQFGGFSEGIPSNDFVVAAGHIKCRYMDARATLADKKSALAGTFMHELGHTLGLRHAGGALDLPQMKPNYLSVMNYTYGNVFYTEVEPDTNGREAFILDYSRGALKTLNENALLESAGLDGPAPCRQPLRTESPNCKILFNSATEAKMEVEGRPVLTLADAESMAVNWDNDNQITEEPLQLPDQQPVDLTRFEYRQRADCGGGVIPPVYETLTSHRDWNVLTYAPPEDTTEPEMAGSSVAEPLAEMDQHLFFSIIDAIWVDQTISTDTSLFRDGFESGEGQKGAE